MSEDDYYNQAVGAVSGTSERRFYACFNGAEDGSNLEVAVFCEENCYEGDTDLLWRFRRSSLQYSANTQSPGTSTDMWCMKIGTCVCVLMWAVLIIVCMCCVCVCSEHGNMA